MMIRIVEHVVVTVLIIWGLELVNHWIVGLNVPRYAILVVMAMGSHWAYVEIKEVHSVIPPPPPDRPDLWDR
jgi:hypothetical protein